MLPFGVTIPATVPQRSEIPEELMNYPVLSDLLWYWTINFDVTVYPAHYTQYLSNARVLFCLNVCYFGVLTNGIMVIYSLLARLFFETFLE
jgi:hypothetical protein